MVDFVRTTFRVSIRRACKAVPAPRSTYHYRSRRPEQAVLRKRIREFAQMRIRYGYRRIWILLRQEGWPINVKRVHRLYKLEGLAMRHKPPRRRVATNVRDERSAATGPNQIWAMDWMYDQLFDGRRIWVLIPTLVDQHPCAQSRSPMDMMRQGWSVRSYEEANSGQRSVRVLSPNTYSGDQHARCSSHVPSTNRYPCRSWRNLRLFGTEPVEVADHVAIAWRWREIVKARDCRRQRGGAADLLGRAERKGTGTHRAKLPSHRHLGGWARWLLDPPCPAG